MAAVRLRRAGVADAAAIAALQVRAWQWAYRGLMPDAFLDTLSVTARELRWRAQLADEDPLHTFVAERDGVIVGFVSCGPAADGSLPAGTGELFALYQEARVVHSGVGRALLAHAERVLSARGFPAALLWVLEGNARARRFYERAGWEPDGTVVVETRADHQRRQLRYRKTLG